VTWAARGIRFRQVTGFPGQPGTRLDVVSGEAVMAVRIRIPAWVAGTSVATVNGQRAGRPAPPGSWLAIRRRWQAGDRLQVTLPMRLELDPAPDDPAVQAVRYGPVVLNGAYGNREITVMPRLDTGSLALISVQPLAARARADGQPVLLIPTARTHHQYYNVYWQT
jgi:DUF1680 family protein